jgi:hypothetical protein
VGGFTGRGAVRLIDAGGAADDGGVGEEGADAGVVRGFSVAEDAAGVVGGTGSSVGFSAFWLSSSAIIRFLGLRCEILIEAAGFDRGCHLE